MLSTIRTSSASERNDAEVHPFVDFLLGNVDGSEYTSLYGCIQRPSSLPVFISVISRGLRSFYALVYVCVYVCKPLHP